MNAEWIQEQFRSENKRKLTEDSIHTETSHQDIILMMRKMGKNKTKNVDIMLDLVFKEK